MNDKISEKINIIVKCKGVGFFRDVKGFVTSEIIVDFRTLLCLA
jgi:hypothetical protein